MTSYLNSLGATDAQSIVSQLHQWWFDLTLHDYLAIQADDTTDYYWRRLIMVSETNEIALACLRLSSIGTSEAEVERLFSIQKNMLSRTVTNLGTATLHHKCILHCNKE